MSNDATPKPRQAPPPPRRGPSLESVTSSTKKLPSRILVHAVQKWGKTSFAAQAPKPIFVCTRDEDGLMTLIDNGQLPPTSHFPECVEKFTDLRTCLHELAAKEHEFKTVVLDTINGAERLAQEHVVESEFNGSWERFSEWGKKAERTLTPFIELTSLLEKVRNRGLGVILLAHSRVKLAKNPEGLDYEKWEPLLLAECQAHLERWCDAILFGRFEIHVEGRDARAVKGKVRGDQTRLLMTESHPTYSAGNRLGLPAEIECGDSAEEAWENFITALKAGRQK